ncbi:MAG: nucleotidyltransferase domain-containing protein [Polyangiaceae bacterium]|nr:nucleotidyltransferase domain-containing protein [Polyangiaceae bacterium]
MLEAQQYGVVAAYLFGSFARGTGRSDSDVDIAVLYAQAPAPTLDAQPFRLEGELERAVGRPVQVVNLHSAPIDLVHRILRDGKLLLDRDRSARIAFEVRARNEYFDLEPVLRRYRRQERPT